MKMRISPITLVGVLLVATFTVLCLRFSAESGRLSTVVNYDDSVYFLRATQLLQQLDQEGFGSVLQNIIAKPLHSPWSVLLAAASYAVSNQQAAPYWANALVVVFFLLFLSYFFRKLPVSWIAGLWISFLCLPYAGMMVLEFRPDLCWSLFTGFGVIWIWLSDQELRDRKYLVISGLLFGCALLIKPSTFALTILLFMCSWSGRQILDGYMNRKLDLAKSARSTLAFVGITTGIALIHYAMAWSEVWSYFWDNSFGDKIEVWRRSVSWRQQFSYYLFGGGARSNIGTAGWFVIAAGLSAAAVVFRYSPLHLRYRMGAVCIALLCTYLINVLGNAKTPFLGGALYSIAFFLSAWCIGRTLMTPAGKRGTALRSCGVGFLMVLCLSVHDWPRYSK